MKQTKPKTMTLRIDPPLAKRFDALCAAEGYSKNGLIQRLMQNFLLQNHMHSIKHTSTTREFKKYFGIFKMGGDAVQDTKDYGL